MPHLIGPDFIGIQAEDLEAARTFYTEIVGLKVIANSPPGAVVFDTQAGPVRRSNTLGRPRKYGQARVGRRHLVRLR